MKVLFIFLSLLSFFLPLEAAIKEKEPLSVVVVGGGPAGLATAIAAHQEGVQITVVEKRPNYSRRQSVTFMEPALKLLETWKVSCPQMQVSEVNGMKVGFVPIHDLEESLAFRVRELGIKILYGEFRNFEEDKQILLITDDSELFLSYDILVGADGTHSHVRKEAGIEINRYGNAIGALALVLLQHPAEISVESNKIDTLFVRRLLIPPRLSILFMQSSSLNEIPRHHFVQTLKNSGWQEEASLIENEKALVFVSGIEIVLQQARQFSDTQTATILVGDAAASASFFEGMGANTALQTASLAGECVTKIVTGDENAYHFFDQAMQAATDELIDKSRYLFVNLDD